jgi:hypothetical protein
LFSGSITALYESAATTRKPGELCAVPFARGRGSSPRDDG